MKAPKNAQATICRMQDAYGRGPWRPGFSTRWVEQRDDLDNLIPIAVQFDLDRIMARRIVGMHLGCGCRTAAGLRRWFTRTEYAALRGYGYQAVRLQVGRILAESPIQCVFERSKPLARDIEPFELYE